MIFGRLGFPPWSFLSNEVGPKDYHGNVNLSTPVKPDVMVPLLVSILRLYFERAALGTVPLRMGII